MSVYLSMSHLQACRRLHVEAGPHTCLVTYLHTYLVSDPTYTFILHACIPIACMHDEGEHGALTNGSPEPTSHSPICADALPECTQWMYGRRQGARERR
jgi:hypothetical protein